MDKVVTLFTLLTAAAGLAAGLSTTEPAVGAAAASPGPILYHIEAMYDPQGNLISSETDAVSMDSLYWKRYAHNYLMASAKTASPNPVNVLTMTFQNAQSTPCMDPTGTYVYEAVGTTLRRFSTSDGSYVDFPLSYTGGSGCATDGQYIYRPRSNLSTTIDKYTMTGTYVNSTTTNYACDAYSISCCRDTIWFTDNRYTGVNLYGYACSQFNGGNINNAATWNVGTGTNGIGNVAWDGTYYYLPWIGTSPITFKRFYADRTLYTTGTVSIDSRSVMCKTRYVPSANMLYWKVYSHDTLWMSEKSTTPNPGSCVPMTFQHIQSTPCMDPTGTYVYEAVGTTLRRFSTSDGSYVDFPLSYTGGSGCATDGQYIYRPRSNLSTTIDKYTMTGTYVNSTTTNYACDAYSISCCRDTIWFTDNRYTGVNLYGYACSQFNGGNINNVATWNVGTGTNGIGNVAWDGANYYLPWIGTSPSTFKLFYADRTLCATGTVSIDSRSVMCLPPPKHDVGCTRIVAPIGNIDSGTVVTPACSVYNYGNQTESYNVRMRIGTYNHAVAVTDHAPGTRAYVTFPSWTALVRGRNVVSCSTELAGDANPANDRKLDSCFVRPPSDVTEPGGLPAVAALDDVVPTPFHNSTVIRFALPQPATAQIAIYSAAGRLVRRLVEGMHPAGYHRVTWDGCDEAGASVARGIYYCRFRAGDFRAIKKLVKLD